MDNRSSCRSSFDRTQPDACDCVAEKTAQGIKALSHPMRLRILCALGGNEVGVNEISAELGASRNTISRHLAILRERSMVSARRQSNYAFYRVGNERIAALVRTLCGRSSA